MYFIQQVTATVTSAKAYNVSFKVHRNTFFTSDYQVPGVSSTAVLTVRVPRILVSQFTNGDGKRLEAFGECTKWRSCFPTDGIDSAGGGADEGVGLPAQIAARGRGEVSASHLLVTSVPAHLPNMPLYKISVTQKDVWIQREDGRRKQQQTSKQDLHDSLVERMWGECCVSESVAVKVRASQYLGYGYQSFLI